MEKEQGRAGAIERADKRRLGKCAGSDYFRRGMLKEKTAVSPISPARRLVKGTVSGKMED